MLDLAGFIGLAPRGVAALPRLVYFHENQLTYPVRHHDRRDLHFAWTNVTTCLAADAVIFNSAYHRDVLLEAVDALAAKMPDHRPRGAATAIRGRASVVPPGIDAPSVVAAGPREPGPLRVLWPHRWEYDKDPAAFFAAITAAREAGAELRLIVVGKSFRDVPEVFARAREEHAAIIDHWGYVDDHAAYRRLLARADVVVSTAAHEFFGIAVVEAVAAGAFPVVPPRLAYPETLGPPEERPEFFYDGTTAGLARRLVGLAGDPTALWGRGGAGREAAGERIAGYLWPVVAEAIDRRCEALVDGPADGDLRRA
jgi:glycosyltransferase involved in cell wall biosynthesis